RRDFKHIGAIEEKMEFNKMDRTTSFMYFGFVPDEPYGRSYVYAAYTRNIYWHSSGYEYYIYCLPLPGVYFEKELP
ncbi:MAG: hypothetical protein K2H34_00825, partial [Lachnospiraceae bacterium]|nr:hypothetical protein [Lachnospiraceae bacterium]